MKKVLALLICCLLFVSIAVTVVKAQAPTLTLNASTDSSLYDRYSTVTYIGTMQYTGGIQYPNDGLVGVQFNDSTGAVIVARTISTGNVIPENIPVDIDVANLGTSGNQMTSIPMPTPSNQVTPSYYVHVINNEATTESMLVTVNIFDSNGVKIAMSYNKLQVGADQSTYVQTNFLIDAWAHYGNAYGYVDVFSDWPSNGGVPLAMEKTFQFTITGGVAFSGTAPTTYSNNGVSHYYNFTFRLPNQQNSALGTYTVYSTANYPYSAYKTGTYVGTQGSKTATFQVAQFGDLNGDGVMNFIDITVFVHDYIAYYTQGTYTASIDFNNDGKLNFADIQLFVHYFLTYYTS